MTYSVVVAEPEQGLLGIAAQSHHFAVGPAVVAARRGVAVMAVQSYGDLDHYRKWVFDALESGVSAEQALDESFAADRRGRRAQVGIATSDGSTAAVTGSACVEAAGHTLDDSLAFQANMCASSAVWEEGAAAYSNSTGDMASRLLASLAAAEQAGGDLRGRQSAVLRVISGRRDQGELVVDVDLRVDDHTDPVAELHRLDAMRRATSAMSDAFSVAASGDVDAAIKRLEGAQAVFGANMEPSVWAAVLLARSRRFAEAVPLAQRAIESHAPWRDFLSNLPAAGLLPTDPETIAMLDALRNG